MLKFFKSKSSYPELKQVGSGDNDGGGKSTPASFPKEPSDKNALLARLEKLRVENLALKRKLWKLQYRGTTRTAIALAGVGAASILISYLLSSVILTFTGLGLILWGILILFISDSRHVPEEVIISNYPSTQLSIRSLLKTLGYTGETIFFHPRSFKGLRQGYIFIPHYAAKIVESLKTTDDALDSLPYNMGAEAPPIFLDPRGIFLASPSQGLVDLFEEKLNVNFALVDLSHVQKTLPSLIIEQLKIADEYAIEDKNDGTYEVTMAGAMCARMCEALGTPQSEYHVDCTFCGANALVISKVTGSPIRIKEIISKGQVITTIYQKLMS